ncbi:hypothetical protein [Geobacter sp.]|uniref:hypothetical protein n=1 Tax=Geobacter sp. TaxID=46610 RepID=UPI001AC86DC3|nr:hypothetical protein [Geobacter sp.]CAG0978466.1 hypothetical protein GEOBC_01677 [Geobacteraceae bacterium]
MDLTLDEHRLIAEFRRLSPAGKQEVFDVVALLQKRQGGDATVGDAPSQNSCALDQKEERPEAAKEPIFTE